MSTSPYSGAAGLLLSLRESTASRVALRRANSPATEHYAYPYLVRMWHNNTNIPKRSLLRAAALCATVPDIENDGKVTLGRLLAASALASVDLTTGTPQERSERRDRAMGRLGKRLVWVQSGDVEKLHTMLRTNLVNHGLEHPRVSWENVVRTYCTWDIARAQTRKKVRRHLLEDFYGAPDNLGASGDSSDDKTSIDSKEVPLP